MVMKSVSLIVWRTGTNDQLISGRTAIRSQVMHRSVWRHTLTIANDSSIGNSMLRTVT
jgi:hypothetical protein